MLKNKLTQAIQVWAKQGKKRQRVPLQYRDKHNIIINGSQYIDFSSNDYLGLGHHQQIKSALSSGIQKYGFGSASSNVLSGYTTIQQRLEERFSEWLNVEKSIVFNCGYMANIGVISSLIARDDVIYSDKLCHASILDGIQISRAKHIRYQHNSCKSINHFALNSKPQCIITESVFSMRGDITPIRKILNSAKKHQAFTIIDDAHAIGVLGHNGKGSHDLFSLNKNDDYCLIAPLGKAFNGMGAIVCANAVVIEAIIQYAKSYKYSTALPPAVCCGLLSALDIIANDSCRRDKLQSLIYFFNNQAIKRGIQLISYDCTPIRAILLGDNDLAQKIQLQLLNDGFYVGCIRPPTVPICSARLRISLNAFHSPSDILKLLNSIEKITETHGDMQY